MGNDETSGRFRGDWKQNVSREVSQSNKMEGENMESELTALKLQVELLTKKVAELEEKNKKLEQKVIWLDIHTEKHDPEDEFLAHN